MILLRRIFLLVVVWVFAHSLFIIFDGLNQPDGKFDIAIVLGNKALSSGPTPRLKARLDRALELYKSGQARMILVSGGVDPEGIDEAKIMAEYLKENEVSEKRLFLDNRGETTWHSAINAKHYIEFIGARTYVVISQYFHLTRTKAAFADAGLKNAAGASPFYFEWRDLYSIPREFLAFYYYQLLH